MVGWVEGSEPQVNEVKLTIRPNLRFTAFYTPYTKPMSYKVLGLAQSFALDSTLCYVYGKLWQHQHYTEHHHKLSFFVISMSGEICRSSNVRFLKISPIVKTEMTKACVTV